MNISGKPYIRIIKEDLAPHLVSSSKDELTNHYTYKFISYNGADNHLFSLLCRRYECWKKESNTVFTWRTKSTFLSNNTIRRSARVNLKEEQVEDISSHTLDATKYLNEFKQEFNSKHTVTGRFKQEYPCEFKQKEKEMSTNKLKVNYIINISVNGNQYSLADPVKPDNALEVVLKLNSRLQFLNDQLNDLEGIKEGTEVIDDKINTNNITKVITNEIDEIKEIIDYINDNLDED